MKRTKDWDKKLSKFIDSRRKSPFKWGAHDCVMFAFDAVVEMTGEDAIQDIRGSWKSKRKAHSVLEEGGGMECMLGELAREKGWKRVHPNFAQRGDLLLFDQEEVGMTLAVCVGASAYAPAQREGVDLLPSSRAIYGYHIK